MDILITIDDDIYNDFIRYGDHPIGSFSSVIEYMLYKEMQSWCWEGYRNNPVTGAQTLDMLRLNLYQKICDVSAYLGMNPSPQPYKERFLCIDIEFFRGFLFEDRKKDGDFLVRNQERWNELADKTLFDVAEGIRKAYPDVEFFQFNEEEFVIPIGERPFVPIENADVKLQYAFVNVEINPIYKKLKNSSGDGRYVAQKYIAEAILLKFGRAMRESTLDLEKIPTLEFKYPETD